MAIVIKNVKLTMPGAPGHGVRVGDDRGDSGRAGHEAGVRIAALVELPGMAAVGLSPIAASTS
jgi:hypothetical protein